MATLVVIQGPDRGRQFRTGTEPCVLGREAEQVPLTDRTTSRKHAEIQQEGTSYILRDPRSANGTFVNGVRIKESIKLKHGDQIKLGATLIAYSSDESSERLSGERIPRDMIDLDAATANMNSAILSSYSSDDSLVLADPELAESARAWRVMSEVTAALGAIIDPDQLLERTMDVVLEELPVDRGFILLYDNNEEELIPHVVRYRRGVRAKKQKISTSRRIIQYALDHRAAVLCTNAATDQRFASDDREDSIHDFGLHSVICAPIMVRDLVLGVIHIDSAASSHTYSQGQLRLMSTIGQMTGLAIHNARLVKQQMQTERLAATGETVAYLSHYIKNILQGIQSGADVVEMGLKKETFGMVGQGWSIVQRNLDRILSLTMNMLAFSKTREPLMRPSHLNRIVEDAVELCQKKASEKGVELSIHYQDEMPPIPLDPDGIHQVVLNIVGNGIDAAPTTDGKVRIATQFHPEEGIADIIIADNGQGIENEKIEEIFEPFRSGKGQGGTGLGLSVAREIVREHHGRIVVDWRSNEGTSFRIRLPVQEMARERGETYRTSDEDI